MDFVLNEKNIWARPTVLERTRTQAREVCVKSFTYTKEEKANLSSQSLKGLKECMVFPKSLLLTFMRILVCDQCFRVDFLVKPVSNIWKMSLKCDQVSDNVPLRTDGESH